MTLVPIGFPRSLQEVPPSQTEKPTPPVNTLTLDVFRLIFSYARTASCPPRLPLVCRSWQQVVAVIREEMFSHIHHGLFGKCELSIPRLPPSFTSRSGDAQSSESMGASDARCVTEGGVSEARVVYPDPDASPRWFEEENPWQALEVWFDTDAEKQVEDCEKLNENKHLVQMMNEIKRRMSDKLPPSLSHLAAVLAVSFQTYLRLLPQRCSDSCVGLCLIRERIPALQLPLLQYVDGLFVTLGLSPYDRNAWRDVLLHHLDSFAIYDEEGGCHDIVMEGFPWFVDLALEHKDYDTLLLHYQKTTHQNSVATETAERKEAIYTLFRALVMGDASPDNIRYVLRYLHLFAEPRIAQDLIARGLVGTCFDVLPRWFVDQDEIISITVSLAEALKRVCADDTPLIDTFMRELMNRIGDHNLWNILILIPRLLNIFPEYFQDVKKQECLIHLLFAHSQGVNYYDRVARCFKWSSERIWAFLANQDAIEVKARFIAVQAACGGRVELSAYPHIVRMVDELCQAGRLYDPEGASTKSVIGSVHQFVATKPLLEEPLRQIYVRHIDGLITQGQSVAIPLQQLFPYTTTTNSALIEASLVVQDLHANSTNWQALSPFVADYLVQVLRDLCRLSRDTSISQCVQKVLRGEDLGSELALVSSMSDVKGFFATIALLGDLDGGDIAVALRQYFEVWDIPDDKACMFTSLLIVTQPHTRWKEGLQEIVSSDDVPDITKTSRALSILRHFLYHRLPPNPSQEIVSNQVAFDQAYDALLSEMVQRWLSMTPEERHAFPPAFWEACARIATTHESLCRILIPMVVSGNEPNNPFLEAWFANNIDKVKLVKCLSEGVPSNPEENVAKNMKQILLSILAKIEDSIECEGVVKLLQNQEERLASIRLTPCEMVNKVSIKLVYATLYPLLNHAADVQKLSDIARSILTDPNLDAEKAAVCVEAMSRWALFQDGRELVAVIDAIMHSQKSPEACSGAARALLTYAPVQRKGDVMHCVKDCAQNQATNKKRALLEVLWESLSFWEHPGLWFTVALKLLWLRMSGASVSQEE